jgi:hypothetical protein
MIFSSAAINAQATTVSIASANQEVNIDGNSLNIGASGVLSVKGAGQGVSVCQCGCQCGCQ